MKPRNMLESFNCAVEGFKYVLKTQKNMRLHFEIGVAILLLGILLDLNKIEILILCGTIVSVLLAEMINTAVELTIDLITDTFHPLARIIKDITAGAVLIVSFNAVVVGYLLFLDKFTRQIENGIFRVKQSSWHITFISLICVLSLVIISKLFFHRGTPFRGGMPSGHSALAFSIWTIVTWVSQNNLLSVLVFVMAAMLAYSRIKKGVHNIWEVIAGGIMGTLVTVTTFQVLSR